MNHDNADDGHNFPCRACGAWVGPYGCTGDRNNDITITTTRKNTLPAGSTLGEKAPH